MPLTDRKLDNDERNDGDREILQVARNGEDDNKTYRT